jgi:hypothetical protein
MCEDSQEQRMLCEDSQEQHMLCEDRQERATQNFALARLLSYFIKRKMAFFHSQ